MSAGAPGAATRLLAARERWEREALAWCPPGYSHSLAVVAPVGSEGGVRIDGLVPPGDWSAVGDGLQLSWLRLDDVADGLHRVSADEAVFATVSGYLPAGYGAYASRGAACPRTIPPGRSSRRA